MDNTLAHDLREDDRDDWSIDTAPTARLATLFGIVLLALGSIALRLVHVQTGLGDDYLLEVSKTVEQYEPIPSRDARILAADGTVLAADEELFALRVHYRWLEEPPHPRWLRQTALARLSRVERKQRARVEAEIERVLADRHRLWDRLAEVTGESPRDLLRHRRELQRRVEHVRALVVAQQPRTEEQTSSSPASDGRDEQPRSAVEWAWHKVVTTLTTPPERGLDPEDLIVKEELEYHTLLSDVTATCAVEIESRPDLFPGTRIELTTRRTYPQGGLAAHVVGYRTPVSEEELAQRKTQFPAGDPLDLKPGDRLGRAGLERAYDATLRGLPGLRKLTLDRRGEVLASEVVRAPQAGRDVVIGLETGVQRIAEQLLDEALAPANNPAATTETTDPVSVPVVVPQGGAIVALDIQSGQVLVAASAPRFDLALLANQPGTAWSEILADERKPLFSRATEMALPPGSVFKVATAIAYVETGHLSPELPFHCRGYLVRPTQHRCLTFRHFGVGHGDVDLAEALAKSCNVYFFDAARRGGPGPLIQWSRKLGFGRPTGIDLPGEPSGNLPGTGAAQRPDGDTLGLAIGQARLTTTPLQLARMMALVANGGTLVTPRLMTTLGGASGQPHDSLADRQEARPLEGLRPATLEWIREGLRRVVHQPGGTGYKTVRTPVVTIAGKTGTAETGGGRPDHAWFAGYAPASNPRVAFVVVLEHAGSGGQTAGPVARRFVEALSREGLLGSTASSPLAN
jgi:penicillin-binding protein 2